MRVNKDYKQDSKQSVWTDESGVQIPYNRTTKLERLLERQVFNLYSQSAKMNDDLTKFKDSIEKTVTEIVEMARTENAVKLDGKGNFTFYNFDRSLKVEVNVNELIRFDDLKIESAKEVLLSIIRNNISGDDFIIGLVEDAFQTSRGRLDTRKILGLKKHTSRIKDKTLKAEWDKAMTLIDQSITRPKSKTYYRVWHRDPAGQYQAIELNFSAI